MSQTSSERMSHLSKTVQPGRADRNPDLQSQGPRPGKGREPSSSLQGSLGGQGDGGMGPKPEPSKTLTEKVVGAGRQPEGMEQRSCSFNRPWGCRPPLCPAASLGKSYETHQDSGPPTPCGNHCLRSHHFPLRINGPFLGHSHPERSVLLLQKPKLPISDPNPGRLLSGPI